MRCLCPLCCNVVTSCLLVDIMCLLLCMPMCVLISCSYVLCVLMALGMFVFVKVMSSLMNVMSPPDCLCSLSVGILKRVSCPAEILSDKEIFHSPAKLTTFMLVTLSSPLIFMKTPENMLAFDILFCSSASM